MDCDICHATDHQAPFHCHNEYSFSLVDLQIETHLVEEQALPRWEDTCLLGRDVDSLNNRALDVIAFILY